MTYKDIEDYAAEHNCTSNTAKKRLTELAKSKALTNKKKDDGNKRKRT